MLSQGPHWPLGLSVSTASTSSHIATVWPLAPDASLALRQCLPPGRLTGHSHEGGHGLQTFPVTVHNPPGFQPQLVALKFVSSTSLPPETRPRGHTSSGLALGAYRPREVTVPAAGQSVWPPSRPAPPASTTVCPRPPPHSEWPPPAIRSSACPLPKHGWSQPLVCSSAAPCPLAATPSHPAVVCTHLGVGFWKAAPVLLTSLRWPPLPWGWSHSCLPRLVDSVAFWPCQPLGSHPVLSYPSLQPRARPVFRELGCALPPPWLFTLHLPLPSIPSSLGILQDL